MLHFNTAPVGHSAAYFTRPQPLSHSRVHHRHPLDIMRRRPRKSHFKMVQKSGTNRKRTRGEGSENPVVLVEAPRRRRHLIDLHAPYTHSWRQRARGTAEALKRMRGYGDVVPRYELSQERSRSFGIRCSCHRRDFHGGRQRHVSRSCPVAFLPHGLVVFAFHSIRVHADSKKV